MSLILVVSVAPGHFCRDICIRLGPRKEKMMIVRDWSRIFHTPDVLPVTSCTTDKLISGAAHLVKHTIDQMQATVVMIKNADTGNIRLGLAIVPLCRGTGAPFDEHRRTLAPSKFLDK